MDDETTTYDYVIIGGGTAGSVLAARLSEDPACRVCVVEGGPSDVGDDRVLKLRNWINLLGGEFDYGYTTEEQPRGNSHILHSRARVLGGCSSHNTLISFLPFPQDLQEWVAAGCAGWGPETILPYRARLRNTIVPVGAADRNAIAKDFVDGLRIAREVAAADPLREWLLREVAPGPEVTSDADLSEYGRRAAHTVYHPAGTCKMGAEDDPTAVVDPELRLRGHDGLRVVDASVFPTMPTINPMVTVLLAAERAADLITARPGPGTADPEGAHQ
ncbi:GMC oxidoreductase [Streptomyces flavofungini]|uniref:GMC oxidoreductase n=1 Tax=Streptomyces flavofungini TaxID=68200 RepID=UPI0034DE6893